MPSPEQIRRNQLRRQIREYHKEAEERARWVHLNPANASVWKRDAAKFRALAAAAEVDLQIAIHGAVR